MRSPRRTEDVGLRILLVAALVFIVIPAIGFGIIFLLEIFGAPEPRPRWTPYDTPAERALWRLRRPRNHSELGRYRDRVERNRAWDEVLGDLREACAEKAAPAAVLIDFLRDLRDTCHPPSDRDRECRRLEFGQYVRLLREGDDDAALRGIWHLGDPDGLEPNYEFVWIHLQSEQREEAANVAAEAVAVREKAGVPDLAAHLEFYALLLMRADRHDEALAVFERLSRLAEDPPPAREPEREEQAADDARPR
jgi:tetratricopeptide (TPR) repeat protein